MSIFTIDNLNFCESVTDMDSQIMGGIIKIENSTTNSRRIKSLFSSIINPVNLISEQVFSDSAIVVSTLTDQTTGESGVLVSTQDGTTQAGVLIGSNSKRIFGISATSST